MKILNHQTTIRLPSTTREELKSFSEAINRHPSTIIRMAILHFIRSYHQNPQEIYL